MKKIILLLSFVVLLVSCSTSEEYQNVRKLQGIRAGKYIEKNYQVIVIDSCEYITAYAWGEGYLAHKGNCKFCKARKEKE